MEGVKSEKERSRNRTGASEGGKGMEEEKRGGEGEKEGW